MEAVTFTYLIGQVVRLAKSLEEGEIVAQARYSYMEPHYLVRYKDSTGSQREVWWCESAITSVP
jgi:hypothetical protein